MQNQELYPRYRYTMGVLDILCADLTHIVNMLAAPMLVFLAADFGIDAATAGYASTLHLLFQGIFMFVGPLMIGWVDNKRTQFWGLTIMILGSVLSFLAPSFPVLLFSRVLTGAGHGLSGACTNSIIAAWFPPKERSVVITINSLGIAAVTLLTYTCTVPLYYALGESWRGVFLSMGIVLFIVNVFWVIFARDNQVLNAQIAARNAAEGKKTNAFSGMKEALSRRDVWTLWLFMGFYIVASNGVSTYLPQYLTNVRGYTEAAASSIVGVANGISAVMTLIGGVITTYIGKRKPLIIPCSFVSVVSIFIALIAKSPVLISGAFILYITGYNLRSSASGTIATELKDATPALVSSAASMSFGLGFICTLACSPLLKFATSAFGAERSMLIFMPMFVLSFIFALMLPETGPGRAKAKK